VESSRYRYQWADTRFAAGIQLLALSGMGIQQITFDGEVAGTDDFNNYGSITLGQRVVYLTDDVELGGRFIQRLPVGFQGSNQENGDLGMTFYVWAILRGFGSIVPRIDFGYDIGSGIQGFVSDGPRQVWDSLGRGGFDAQRQNMVIRPSVQFQVSGTQFFEMGYCGQFDLSTVDAKTPGRDQIHNVFAQVRVSF
jgi:hypothetical protein